MRKILYLVGVFMAVGLAIFNVFTLVQKEESGGLTAVAIETSAQPMARNGVESCDILKYQRNYREDWVPREAINGYVEVNGESRYVGKLVGGGEVKINVQVPLCVSANDNCCEKKHLDKDIKLIK